MGDGIRVHVTYDISGNLILILIKMGWLQKLGKNWQ